MPGQWVSTKEAAQLIGVSQRTIQNWVDDGKLQASLTVGGHRRLDRKELERFLVNNESSYSKSLTSPIIDKPSQEDKESALRILIVEDDQLILRLYKLRFAEFSIPHQLLLAQTPLHALFLAGRHLPHMIFTDIRMPHINGLQMISELIELPEMQQTKIVVVTGLETREIMKMGKLPEDIVVLPKPIPFNTVETLLYQKANALNIPCVTEKDN